MTIKRCRTVVLDVDINVQLYSVVVWGSLVIQDRPNAMVTLRSLCVSVRCVNQGYCGQVIEPVTRDLEKDTATIDAHVRKHRDGAATKRKSNARTELEQDRGGGEFKEDGSENSDDEDENEDDEEDEKNAQASASELTGGLEDAESYVKQVEKELGTEAAEEAREAMQRHGGMQRDGPRLLGTDPGRVVMFVPGQGVRPFPFSRVFPGDAQQGEE